MGKTEWFAYPWKGAGKPLQNVPNSIYCLALFFTHAVTIAYDDCNICKVRLHDDDDDTQ